MEADQQFVREKATKYQFKFSTVVIREQLELIKALLSSRNSAERWEFFLCIILFQSIFKTVKEEILDRTTEPERLVYAKYVGISSYSEKMIIKCIFILKYHCFGSNVYRMLYLWNRKLLAPQQYSSEPSFRIL